jgi:hypothetical protein
MAGKGDGAGPATTSYWLEWTAADQLAANIPAGGSNHLLTATDFVVTDVANWHFVAATYDGATMRVYLDGRVSTVTLSFATAISQTALTFALGRLGSLANFIFQGVMREFYLWDRALRSDEILRLYAEPYAFMRPMAPAFRFPEMTFIRPAAKPITGTPWAPITGAAE